MDMIEKRSFESIADFFKKLFDIFRGPTFLMTWLKIDKILREKILLTISMSNKCSNWIKAHSALGKRLGISKEEIDDLISLNFVRFDYREWIVLKYVQDWTFLRGKEPAKENISEYYLQYNKKERAYILKLMRVMLFSNYINNAYKKK